MGQKSRLKKQKLPPIPHQVAPSAASNVRLAPSQRGEIRPVLFICGFLVAAIFGQTAGPLGRFNTKKRDDFAPLLIEKIPLFALAAASCANLGHEPISPRRASASR
jgi:hypothetical protein